MSTTRFTIVLEIEGNAFEVRRALNKALDEGVLHDAIESCGLDVLSTVVLGPDDGDGAAKKRR